MKHFSFLISVLAGGGPLLLAPGTAARAQQATPPLLPPTGAATATRPTAPTVALSRALERIGNKAGLLVLADSTVAYERVPAPPLPGTEAPPPPATPTSDAEATVEKELNALVKTLPAGTVWGKLYLPPPPAGRVWKGDDVAAFAFAQVRLFGTVGNPVTDGGIEILGKRVSKDAAPPFVAGLGLRPVYLVSNLRRPMMNGTPWSAATQEQWAAMSKDERKQYGRQQAEWIMSLPQAQRDQMLEQIRQHDKYFDTVKDPLEKLIGHDL